MARWVKCSHKSIKSRVSGMPRIHGKCSVALQACNAKAPMERWVAQTGESPEIHRSASPACTAANNSKQRPWFKHRERQEPMQHIALGPPEALTLTHMYK